MVWWVKEEFARLCGQMKVERCVVDHWVHTLTRLKVSDPLSISSPSLLFRCFCLILVVSEVVEDDKLLAALMHATNTDGVYQLPPHIKYPVEKEDEFSGMLIMRQAHVDMWTVVNEQMLKGNCPVLIVVGPAGVGKVRFQ